MYLFLRIFRLNEQCVIKRYTVNQKIVETFSTRMEIKK